MDALVYIPQYIRRLRKQINELEWEHPDDPQLRILKDKLAEAEAAYKRGETYLPLF